MKAGQVRRKREQRLMRIFKLVFALGFALVLAACGDSTVRDPKFRTYNGPEVTFITIDKTDRKMRLFHNNDVLETYDIALGFAPRGHKQFEGDGKTPEGLYYIDRRNPRSRFHLSLGISYPNKEDIAFAKAQGKSPGGEIFIHGKTGYRGDNKGDWTWGCLAVTDREMEDIYAMVKTGTPIRINP
ncbi:MAG: murein L,D-transpeptidase YafK [Pseudorhodobacter sp.]